MQPEQHQVDPKPRVIITTDMEVDDMNSAIHLALHLNELDVEAFVYTASQYHFLGDGQHTLGEVNPHWRTKGHRSYEADVVPPGPDPTAGELTSYRPFPTGWLERLWLGEYAQAWPHLCENSPQAPYPSPEELVARTYVGNVAFEGDVREDTPGSRVIEDAILDDDPRTLWLLSWGGMNTIVRALMSIARDHAGDPAWEELRQRIYDKVRIAGVAGGVGQDNSWEDHGRKLFPHLKMVRPEFMYGGYVDARAGQADTLPLFQAPWPQNNITQGNGPLMERYMLYGDGKVYENEPERFQFGTHATLDWGWPGMEPIRFTPGDFMAEGDSMTYIPLLPVGLRGAQEPWYESAATRSSATDAASNPRPGFTTILGRLFLDDRDGGTQPPAIWDYYEGQHGDAAGTNLFATRGPNPYLRAYQEEFAARAQWCAHSYDECNHAPHIFGVTPDTTAAPGEIVELYARATDPDGDALITCWMYDEAASAYSGEATAIRVWKPARLATHVTTPRDAKPGDTLIFTLEVQDTAARPLTRYAQVAITVS